MWCAHSIVQKTIEQQFPELNHKMAHGNFINKSLTQILRVKSFLTSMRFMIENAHKVSIDGPEFRAQFQQEILEHWQEIKGSNRFPQRRDFRPQKFPKFLGQLAIVNVKEGATFADRLTGGTVCEVLRLSDGSEKLTAPSDQKIAATIQRMLAEAFKAEEPMYYTGRFTPDTRPPIDFSTLVIPFVEKDGTEIPESLLLAFDFTKHATTNLFAAS